MNKIITIFTLLFFVSCGFSQRNSELIGQVKSLKIKTPILCGNHTTVEISLGVMRGGVGSVSNEDIQLEVINPEHFLILKKANEEGKLVKIIFDESRFEFCRPFEKVTSVNSIK